VRPPPAPRYALAIPTAAVSSTSSTRIRRGRLLAAFESHGSDKPKRDPGLLLRTSTTGTSFTPAQTLVPGDNVGQIQLGATNDGGGFAVLNRTGFVNAEGEIDAAGFGNQAATGKPGIADIPGGAGVVPSGANCDQLKFGSFQVDSAEGCFLRGTGASKGVFVTGGEINLWGLRIIPDPGCRLIIDPKSLQFDTSPSCGARVVVTAPLVGDITLWHGEIHRDLSKVVPGTDLFEFPAGAFKANILGFDVGADINIRLENDGVHIPVDLQLPAAFGGFSGHAELVADRQTGLHINSLHLHIGPVPLGVLVINKLDLDYQSNGGHLDRFRVDHRPGGRHARRHRQVHARRVQRSAVQLHAGRPDHGRAVRLPAVDRRRVLHRSDAHHRDGFARRGRRGRG